MPRNYKRKMSGGALKPGEYFGDNTGRYVENPSMVSEFAYGTPLARSHGVFTSTDTSSGPNLGVYPTDSMLQTGGGVRRRNMRSRRRRRRTRRTRLSKRSKRCGGSKKNSKRRRNRRV